jgi:hypothetical protein
MSEEKDGGPAFPRPSVSLSNGGQEWGCDGLTARDWFAGQALAGLVQLVTAVKGPVAAEELASIAYGVADAILAERDKR